MNAAQIHLALNHAPLLLSLVGGGILILGMIKKNDSFKSLSLYILVAAAILTAPVFLSGEGTEELVENLPGVNEKAIESHQDMAKISLIVIIITGVLALAGIILRKNASISRIIFIMALILSLASFGTMAQTAHLGGLIRHNEIQNGTSSGANNKEDEDEEKEKKPVVTDQQPPPVVKDSIPVKREQVKKDDDD